jgi:phage terminase small subunit
MGKRGPKAKSQQIGILPDGLSEKRPGPPTGMCLRAHRVWKKVVASLPPIHFRPGDYPLLRAYCEAEALHFEASQKITEEGAVIKLVKIVTDKKTEEEREVVVRVKTNPWVAIQTQTAHTMSQLATKLRLCANARITPQGAGKEAPKPKSKRAGIMYE